MFFNGKHLRSRIIRPIVIIIASDLFRDQAFLTKVIDTSFTFLAQSSSFHLFLFRKVMLELIRGKNFSRSDIKELEEALVIQLNQSNS